MNYNPLTRARLAMLLRTWGLLLALILIAVAMSIAHPAFLTVPNLINVARQVSINGILAIGVTLVLLTGGVDLSLGSVVALAGVVAALFAQDAAASYGVIIAVAAGIATGAGCGAVNGLVITRGKVPPFIATLGMMTAARGLALLVSNGRPVSNLDAGFTRLGADLGPLPIPVIVMALLAVLVAVVLNRFRLGRHILAVGGNPEAARAAGIRVGVIGMIVYSVCGALAGLAGVVLAARITTGQPNAGVGFELDAIAAVVIGGTSLSGGVGRISGTILGVLLVGVINNGLDLLNVSSYYQAIVKGVIIIGAVWLDRNRHRS
ncbi:MAG TPA: ABC transporter permease [Luteolibacter sp.]|nr:ABC transporter permease [Luteolibacter sp.]